MRFFSVTLLSFALVVRSFPSVALWNYNSTFTPNGANEEHLLDDRDVDYAEFLSRRIDVSGDHKFVPPGDGDLRGPCPALNALANHNYFPRNGIVGMVSGAQIVSQVYDFALVLTAYATILCGNILTLDWSIGGRAPGFPPVLPIVGGGEGLSGSHNKYESDGSATHGEYYLTNGDVDSIDMSRFKHLLGLQKKDSNANYNLDVFTAHRGFTIQKSISENPYFFFPPFAGLLVSSAGHTFPPAMFSNWTPAHPNGQLSRQTLLSFYAVTEGANGQLSFKKGWERIPDNWYRRPQSNEYGIDSFTEDLLSMAARWPGILKIGGNVGRVNSFTGVDIGDLTGGIYHIADLLDPKRMVCFMYQLVTTVLPDTLRGGVLGDVIGLVISLLDKTVVPMIDPSCPGIEEWNEGLLQRLPGAEMGVEN